MKNKIFSKGLYFEGLRQLKMIGIIFSVILSVFSAAIPVMEGISRMPSAPNGGDVWAESSVYRSIISGVEANPFLFAVFLVLAPLMTLVLFGFLNKRRTSDFYHSIPHTRLSVYISFIASILTWAAILILSSSLAATIAYLIFSKYFTVLYADLLVFMLNAFVTSILAIGATAIAVSITGTPFTNVLFTSLILFLPRILITVINSVMIMQTPILVSGYSFFLFENGYNLYTTIFFNVFTTFNVNAYLSIGGGTVYTLVLGLIFLILAAWLFVKRKSESAERSAPSRFLQAVYRIIVTTAFCMIPCVIIFMIVTDGYGFDSGDITGLIILYILALILYFVYELITTRKWKNLLRAMPGLAIVLVCNLAIIGGLHGIRAYHLSFKPTADEITGVSVVYGNNRYTTNYGSNYDDYVYSQLTEIVLDSPEAKEIVSKGLSDSAGTLKKYGSNQYWWRMNELYGIDRFSSSGELEEMTFRITTKSGSRVRQIRLTSENIEKINRLLVENEQYYDLWTNIPDPATYDLYFAPADSYSTLDEISVKDQKEFVSLLQADVKALGYDKWYNLVVNNKYSDASDTIGYVSYPIKVGSTVQYYRIPICYSNTPKAAAFFLKLYSSDEQNRRAALDALKSAAESKDRNFNYTITLYSPVSGTFTKYQAVDYGTNSAKIAEFLTSKVKSGSIGNGDTFILLDLDIYSRIYDTDGYDYYYTDYLTYQTFIPIYDVTAEELEEYGFYSISDKYPPDSEPYYDDIIYD